MPPNSSDQGVWSSSSPGADAFDIWLRESLRRLYSDVAVEPIPPELLCMVTGSETAARAATEPILDLPCEVDITDTGDGFEQRVRERAYFLWLKEGCPEHRALQHWTLACIQQATQHASERRAASETPKRSMGVLPSCPVARAG